MAILRGALLCALAAVASHQASATPNDVQDVFDRNRRGAGCKVTDRSGWFKCPDSGVRFPKKKVSPKENCECHWFFCHKKICKPTGEYETCEVDRSKCDCPTGKKLTGCGANSAPEGDVKACGTCEPNGPGQYCNDFDRHSMCHAGAKCLGSGCCAASVKTDNCLQCGQKLTNPAEAGKCISWKPGYTGSNADECTKDRFMNDDGKCVADKGSGGICSKDTDCKSNRCGQAEGGDGTRKCCDASADKDCDACNSQGTCSDCGVTYKDARFNCGRCQSGYYEDYPGGPKVGGRFVCKLQKDVGMCEATIATLGFSPKDAAKNGCDGNFCPHPSKCRAGDCRQNCCGAQVANERLKDGTINNNNMFCDKCDTDGACKACKKDADGADLFTLVDISGDKICMQKCETELPGTCPQQGGVYVAKTGLEGDRCTNPGKEWDCPVGCTATPYGVKPFCVRKGTDEVCRRRVLIEHGKQDTRRRYKTVSPTKAGETCDSIEEVESRTCSEGTFSDWKSAKKYAFDECTERCVTPNERGVQVCSHDNITYSENSTTADASSCREARYVAHGEHTRRMRYKQANVDPPLTCEGTGQLQLQQCISQYDQKTGKAVAALGPATPNLYTFPECHVNCAPGCTLKQEVNDTHCHPECNVESCCHQHGTCAALMYEDYIDAKLLSFDVKTTDAAVGAFNAICKQPGADASTDDSQLQLWRASCQMTSSLADGMDMLGRNQNFADPLEWEKYEAIVGKHMDALESVESALGEADQKRQDSDARDFLVNKMALMQIEIGADVKNAIKEMDAKQGKMLAALTEKVDALGPAQREHYEAMRRQLNHQLLNQESMQTQLQLAEETMLESDQALLVALKDSIEGVKEDIIESIKERTNQILLGQNELAEGIAENGERLHEIANIVRDIQRRTIENAALLKELMTEYEAERQDVIEAQADADELREKIATNAGWDWNMDGDVSFEEMFSMLQDFELLEGPALAFMDVIEEADEDQRPILITDAVGLTIQRQANVRTQVWMTNKGLIAVTQEEADLDGDGTISVVEALQLLVLKNGIYEEGGKIFAAWAGMMPKAGARRHRRDFASGLAKWKNFMCKSQNSIHTILKHVAPRFSVDMVKNRIERVKGLIEAIKTLVDLISNTVSSCVNAVSGIAKGIAGIFTGNIVGGVMGIVGAVGDTVDCVSGIMEIVQQAKSTYANTMSLAEDLIQDVKTIKNMVTDLIAIGQDKEDCVLVPGADIASLMTSAIGFVQTNLQIDVTSKLAKNRNLRVGLEFLQKGLEAMANPSPESLVALIPTGAIANLGVSDTTIALMKQVATNALSGKSPLAGITSNQFAGAIFAEIGTFADAVGGGDIVDKISGFVNKLGKSPGGAKFTAFLKEIGNAPPTPAQFQKLLEGLPSQLGNVGKGMLGTFLAGVGDTPIVQKLKSLAGGVGKFLPYAKHLETYLIDISAGRQGNFADLEAFVKGIPTTIAVAKGRIDVFVNALNGKPPSLADINNLVDTLGLLNPGFKEVDALLATIKKATGSDIALQIQEFVQKLPSLKLKELVTDLGKGKLPSATQVQALMELLPDKLTDGVTAKIGAFVLGLKEQPAAKKILGLMKTLGIQEPTTKQVKNFLMGLGQGKIPTADDLQGFAAGLMPKLGRMAVGQIGVFVKELAGGSPTVQTLTSLFERLGKDVPGANLITDFVKDLGGVPPTAAELTTFVQQVPSLLKQVAKGQLDTFVAGLGGTVGERIRKLAEHVGRVVPATGKFADKIAALTQMPGLQAIEQLIVDLPEKLDDFAQEQVKTFVELTEGKLNAETLEVLLDGLDKAIPDGNVVDDFIKTLSGGVATYNQIEGFVQLLPGKLTADKVGQLGTFLSGISPVGMVDKVKGLVARIGKATPDGEMMTKITDLLGAAGAKDGSLPGKLADLLKVLPNQLESVNVGKIGTFVKSLKDKVPDISLLEGLAKGIGKVPDTKQITKFIADLEGKVPGVGTLTGLMEKFQDGKAAVGKLESFVNGLGESSTAQNDWWRALNTATGLKTEQTLQNRFTESTCTSLGRLLGAGSGCAAADEDGGRFRRQQGIAAINTAQSTCHANAAISVKRLFDTERRFHLEKMRNLQHRLLELFHKQRRQLEYKWLEDLKDEFSLSALTVADFRVLQSKLSDFNLRRQEESASSSANERVVSFTVSRQRHPEEFAKLGLQETNSKGDSRPKSMVFAIDAPTESSWYASYVTKAEAYLVPFTSGQADDRVNIKIIKGATSQFLLKDGAKASSMTFQHAPNTRQFDYFVDNCEPASKEVLDSALIRYSPYGKWHLQVQTAGLGDDFSSLLDVSQIQLRFTLQHKTVDQAATNLPLFANDIAAPNGVTIWRPGTDSQCPVEVEDILPNELTLAREAQDRANKAYKDAGCPDANNPDCVALKEAKDAADKAAEEAAAAADKANGAGAGSASDGDSDSDSTVIVVVVVLAVVALLIVAAVVVRMRTVESERFGMGGNGNDVSLRVRSVRRRLDTVTVQQLNKGGTRSGVENSAYAVPLEVVPGRHGSTGASYAQATPAGSAPPLPPPKEDDEDDEDYQQMNKNGNNMPVAVNHVYGNQVAVHAKEYKDMVNQESTNLEI